MARGGGGRGGGGSFGGGGFGGGRGGGSSFGGSRGGGRRLGGGSSRGRGGPGRTSSGNRRPSGSGGGYRRPGGFWGPRPFFGGWGGGYRGYGGYGRRYRRGGCGGCSGGGCGGCLTGLIALVAILFIFNFVWTLIPGTNNTTAVETVQINNSTREREPLEAGLVNETPYYEDNLEWIDDSTEMEDGLRYFYEQTNIQPFVYITDNIDGDPNPSPDEIDAFANNLYDEFFTDEAHLLLVHFENWDIYDYDYSYHTVIGSQATILMDNEAENILYDYLDYHYPRDITEEAYFSESFRDTADRIMNVTRSPWIPVAIVVGVAVIIYLLFTWWRSAFNQNKDENRTDEDNKKEAEEFDF